MSSSKERADLKQRLDGLESTIMQMAAQGLEVPENLAEELYEVQTQLKNLGDALRIKPWTSWLGENIEEFILVERLSSGTYSHVFRARKQSGEECAIKVAASLNSTASEERNYFAKQVIQAKGAQLEFMEFSPNEALQLECERLQADDSGIFVKVLSSGHTAEKYFYYRMPLLTGQSLKDILALNEELALKSGVEILSKLASVIQTITDSESNYHGNLQADNIFISKTNLVLLSPGVFQAGSPNLLFTTAAYYPFFEPDDPVAIGFVLWELVCKLHPLAPSKRPERPEVFAEMIRALLTQAKKEDAGPLQELLKFSPPRKLAEELSAETESFLMRAIRMGIDHEGYLTITKTFESPSEFSAALNELAENGLFPSS